MASTTFPQYDTRRHSHGHAGPVARLAARIRVEWHRRRTERILAHLPAEIRKDIGWPAGNSAEDRGRRNLRDRQ